MEFLNSPFAGSAILLVVVAILCVYISGKTKRDHAAAMEEYERKMVAYRAAIEGDFGGLKNGVPFAPPDITMEGQSDAVAPYFGPGSRVGFGMAAALSAGGEGQVELVGIDERTAALVIAILCEQLGGDPSRLSFHSIKAV